MGGESAQGCARANSPAARLHSRERRGGGGAIKRAAQTARSGGRSTSRSRDSPPRPRRGAQATCEGREGQELCSCGSEHFVRARGGGRRVFILVLSASPTGTNSCRTAKTNSGTGKTKSRTAKRASRQHTEARH